MHPDRVLFARLEQYILHLPHQLSSYPAVETKADFSIILRQKITPTLQVKSLPYEARSILSAPWSPGDWIPWTSYAALCAIARDFLWTSDEAYQRGMFEVATEMYSGPAYRLLFFMLGPSIVAMSAAKRWGTIHRGTDLVIKKQKKESIDAVLTYPSKLVSETALQSLGAAFCAIAQGSRGQDPKFTVISFDKTQAEFTISWTY